MKRTVAISILALSLNANLVHANNLAAITAAELAETIFDKLNNLPEGKCLSADTIVLERVDISHAIFQSIANNNVAGLFTINTSVCKKIDGASSLDIKSFSITIGNEFIDKAVTNEGSGNIIDIVYVKQ